MKTLCILVCILLTRKLGGQAANAPPYLIEAFFVAAQHHLHPGKPAALVHGDILADYPVQLGDTVFDGGGFLIGLLGAV